MAKVVKLKTSTARKRTSPPARKAPRSIVRAKVKAPVARPRSTHFLNRMSRLRVASYAIGVVALILTALSLSHLAAGVQMLTGSTEWHAWAMAIGVDLCFIALELGQLCITTEVLRQKVSRFAVPAVQGTLVVSAIMNAYAFAIHATTSWYAAAACALGVAIPALIYVCTRVSVAMWIETHRS